MLSLETPASNAFSQKWMNCGGGFIRTSYYNEFIKILCLSNIANIQTLILKNKFI